MTGAAQDHPVQRRPVQVRWAPAELNKQAKKATAQGLTQIPSERARIYLQAFHHGIAVGPSLHPRAPGHQQSPTRNLLERLRDRSCDVLRLADNPAVVPFTSNTGERALRPVKTQVKTSGCHQSEISAAAWLAELSPASRKRKRAAIASFTRWAVRRRLGHASAETTQLYALLDDKVTDVEIRAA